MTLEVYCQHHKKGRFPFATLVMRYPTVKEVLANHELSGEMVVCGEPLRIPLTADDFIEMSNWGILGDVQVARCRHKCTLSDIWRHQSASQDDVAKWPVGQIKTVMVKNRMPPEGVRVRPK